jgi:hypothetical protein
VTADVSAQLRALVDRQAIHDVVLRYARGIDRLDWALVAGCFHDDGEVDASWFSRRAWPLYEARRTGADVAHLGAWADLSCHYVLNCLIDLDGDTARSETYCVAVHRTRCSNEQIPLPIDDPGDAGRPGQERDVVLGLRYVDRFERRMGLWAIRQRTFVYEWTRVDAVTGRWRLDPAQYRRGRRDRQDIAYG